MAYSVGALIVSDRAAAGIYQDQCLPVIAGSLQSHPQLTLAKEAIVPDEIDQIAAALAQWRDEGLALIVTSGGTGFSPRDVTPEATRQIIDREAPGIAETLRAESYKITKHAMLSRGVAGIADNTLIINLPGSPKAAAECMEILLLVLPHALGLLSGAPKTESDHRSV